MSNKDKKNITSFDFGNTAAEKWTFEMTDKFFKEALEYTQNNEIYHLSEIAVKFDTYLQIFFYLVEKYPVFETIKKKIDAILLSRLQRGGLTNELNGNFTKFHISANYGWAEKTETKNEIKTDSIPLIEFIKNE